ncbi:MAG: glycosyltransferase [Lysobacterales bacterium]
MRHALFIAFHYPPEASSSGVLRTLKYSRYLHDFGWRVSVIAPRVDAYAVTDERLTEQIRPDTRVVRTRWINSKRHLSLRGIYPALFAVPDTWIGWMPWAVAAGRDVLRDDPPHLIYSTSPHATAHVIAWRLARRSRLPWVADFRDPWVEDPPEPGAPSGPLYTGLNRWLERQVVENGSHIVTSTTHLRDLLRSRYPRLAPTRITPILNGYDEADFANFPPAAAATSDRLVIVHAGNINPEFRDPRPLLRALRRLVDRGVLVPERICLRFIGGGEFGESSEMRAALQETNLALQVEFVGRLAYDAALRELARADVLLLLQASSDTVSLVPAKLYEYLRAQKPVLALVHPGATSEVLNATGGGWSVDPRDDRELGEALTTLIRLREAGTLAAAHADLARLRRFDRKALAGELAAIFDRLRPRLSSE